jgi:hypothetical protein
MLGAAWCWSCALGLRRELVVEHWLEGSLKGEGLGYFVSNF